MTCINTGYDIEYNFLNDANFSDTAIKNLGNAGADCDLVSLIASSNTQDYYTNLIIETNNNQTLDFGNTITLDSSSLLLDNTQDWFIFNNEPQLTLQSTTITGNLNWLLANFTIDSGTTISANIRGCPNSQSPNANNICSGITGEGYGEGEDDGSHGGGGGGHGGRGGKNSNNEQHGGYSYDDPLAPIYIGSGGGNGAGGVAGGTGGGAIKINVTDTFNNSGSITANGGNGGTQSWAGAGGGSGGSIYIITDTLVGNGNLFANGGNGGDNNYDGGGGSGGRIAVFYNNRTDTNTISSSVAGGTGPGGAADGDLGTLIMAGAYETDYSPLDSTGLINNQTPVQIRTNYSIITSSNQINRTIISTWTNVTMTWNDSASDSSTVATYNATGLKSSTNYTMSDNLVEHANSPSLTDASGNLDLFTVTLSSEHRVDIVELVEPTVNNITTYNSSWGIINYTFSPNNNVTFNVSITPGARPLSDARLVIWEVSKNGDIFFNTTLTQVGDIFTAERNITAPLSTIVYYTVYANDTLNYTSEMDGNFTLLGPPVIRNVYAAEGGYLNGDLILQANVSDDNLATVNFTIERTDGLVLAANHLGTNHTPSYWNATTVTLTNCSIHNYTVVAYDEDGYSTTSTGNITFDCITLDISPNPANNSGNVTLSGQVTQNDESVIGNNQINVYLDGALQTAPQDWWNTTWTYRTNLTVDTGYTIRGNNTVVKALINFSSIMSDGGITGTLDNNSIRVIDWSGKEMPYDILNWQEVNSTAMVRWKLTTNGSIAKEKNFTYYVYFDTTANGLKNMSNYTALPKEFFLCSAADSGNDHYYAYSNYNRTLPSSWTKWDPEVSNEKDESTIADFDNDGDYDIAWTSDNANKFFVYENNGDSSWSFSESESFSINNYNWYGLCEGDFNEDGYLDLIINDDNCVLRYYENDGDGTFTVGTSPGDCGNEPRKIACGDLNNDNNIDILAGGYSSGCLYWIKGDGDGTFTDSGCIANSNSEGGDWHGVWIVDNDNDGDMDVYGQSRTSDPTIQYYENDGTGTFSNGVDQPNGGLLDASPANNQWGSGTVGDYDNDGVMDLLDGSWTSGTSYMIAYWGNPNNLTNIFNDGTPSATSSSSGMADYSMFCGGPDFLHDISINLTNSVETLTRTNATGHYTYNMTAPALGGTYEIQVNATGYSGQGIDDLIVKFVPTIESVETNESAYGMASIYLTANITDDNLIWVNFTVTDPDGIDVLDNENGTVSGSIWNSSVFILNKNGTYTYEVNVSDADGLTDSASGSIDFVIVGLSLSPNPANINNLVNITGHVNLTNGTVIDNHVVEVYFDGVKNTSIAIAGWDNASFDYRMNLTFSQPNSFSSRTAEHIRINISLAEDRLSGADGAVVYCNESIVPFDGHALQTTNNWVTQLQGLIELDFTGDETKQCYLYYSPDFNGTSPAMTTTGWHYVGDSGNSGENYEDISPAMVDCNGYDADGQFTSLCSANDNLKMNEWCYFKAPATDASEYFKTGSDDGTGLWVDGTLVVTDNNGPHGVQWRDGTYGVVEGQFYGIEIDWAEGGGGQAVYNRYNDPGDDSGGEVIDTECYPFYGDEWTIVVTNTSEEVNGQDVATNGTGDYSYNLTTPSTGGTYPIMVNITYNGSYGQSTANLNVQQTPVINSVETNTTAYLDQSIYLIANLTDENLMEVNFTVTDPDSVVVIDNVNGSETGVLWNSSAFTLSRPGTYTYEVNATDADGLTASTSGSIDFVIVELNLNPNPVMISADTVVSGHVNITNTTNITNTVINIYFNGTLQEGDGENWWNSSWPYRKQFNITENSGSNLTDFQINLSINTTELVEDGKLNTNCSDLRFIDNETNELNYWLENATNCNSSSTIVWVETNLTADINNTLYMYYGNTNALEVTNGSNVFLFFDDFEGSSLDASKWSSSGTVTVSDSIVTVDRTGSDSKFWNPTTFSLSKPFIVETLYQNPSSNRNRLYLTTSANGGSPVGHDYGIFGQIYWNAFTGITLNNDQWYLVKWTDTASDHLWQIFTTSGTQISSYAKGSTVSSTNFLSFQGTENSASDFKLDWVRIRKYASTEPTQQVFGSEEIRLSLTNATADYSLNITAFSTPGTYPVVVNLTSGNLFGQSSANLVVANITDDVSINQTLIFTPASLAENQTVEINATVYGGTDNYTNVNVSLYIDNIFINNSVINLSPSETEYVLFNWTTSPLNRTIMVSLDGNNSIYETNESNNNATANLWVTKVAVMEYIGPENGTHIIRGRTDATEEDPEDSVSNATTLQARIYNLYNSSEGVIGNCTFYFNNTLLGVNPTDTDGYCNYTFDHSIYTAGAKNLTVNFTDTNSSYSKHTDNIEHNKTLIITVYETTLATDNTRPGNFYRNGDAAVLYINTTKDGVLENVSNFTLEIRKSSPDVVLITQTYPGDIEILGTGQYRSIVVINATFVNTAIHWKIYVDDNQIINNTPQITVIPATSGSHSDIDIQPNNAILNLSIVNESNTQLQGSRILLRDKERRQLRNVPINNHHPRLVRPASLNDKYQIKYTTDNGTIVDMSDVNASTTPFTLQPQVVQTYSGQRPENAQNLTTVIAINQTFNFTNATITIPFNGLRPRGITYIYHCLDWDFSTAICNNWEENTTNDYPDYSENATHFSFTVTSFTGYAGGAGYNANLTIDNNGPKTTDVNITFNASYINNSNSAFITVADCNISFDDGTWALMTEMSNRYEHNKSFTTSGNHTYNVTCSNLDFDTLNATDNVTVLADTGVPSVTLTSPVNNNFTNLNNITFACYANNTNLENISLFHNISQAYGINQTNNVSGADADTEFNVTEIPEGEYLWNCLAYDVSDNSAFATNNFTVTVDTITPNVSIGINDTTPEFSISSVFIDWNASDKNLHTQYMNITYQNGTLILNSTNNSVDIILTTTNLSVKGTYTINAFANDSASNSNTTTITFTVLNTLSTHGTPILNSTFGNNLTNENLTVYNISTSSPDSDSTKNIINWYKNGTSITVLNMPFEADGDQNATDYSPFQNNGTVTGATWNATGGYDGKGAFEFDGSGYINTSDFADTAPITISTWVYATAFTEDSFNINTIIGKENGVDDSWVLRVGDSGISQNQLQWVITESDGTQVKLNGPLLNTDQWYHIVIIYDSTGNQSIYLDGSNTHSQVTADGTMENSNITIEIGRSNLDNGRIWKGKIDEVQIFNRSLTTEQIEALYQNRTDLIVSQETSIGDIWNATITPNDGVEDGITKWSNALTILADNPPTVTLISPPDQNFTSTNITFICNATDANLHNISLYHNISQTFGINQTFNTTGTTDQAIFTVNNTANGNHTWNCLAFDIFGNSAFASANFSTIVDLVAPNVTSISPENNFVWNTSSEVSFIFNVTDKFSNKTNCSLFINDTYYKGNDTVINVTNNYTQTLDSGNYTWFISCFDNSNNVQNSTTRNLTVSSLFGSLNITWITPTANINVNHNEFFLMTVNVSCAGGDCGNVSVTLDPEPINETNETLEIEINETIENTNTTQINETNNETIEDVVVEEINFEFFTLENTYILGETIYFYILPTNTTYTINITPLTGTLQNLEFTPTQTGIYNITSTLEFENQSESFSLNLTIIEEIEEETNETEALTYDEGENITQEDKHLGEKIEDEIHFETYFTNITQTNTTLTVTFYHDYIQSLPVWIEGDISYTLTTTNAEPYENTTLEVTLVEGIIPRFNLHLGEESEVFEFGKVIPDVDIDHGEAELIDRNDEKLDINITKNNNSIELEGVAEETDIYTYIEPTDQFPTDIVAVEPLDIEQATITLTTDTTITKIFECPDELFNYETLECLEWNQTNITFTQEDNQITFTVTHFSGYAGGNLTNNQTSYLTIWDELDQGEPNTTNVKLLNQNTLFFANYLTTQNLTKITNGNCTLNFTNTLYPMTYNSSYTYYTANRSFATAGTYTYTITCTHSTYSNITAQDDIRVPTNKGVVPTTPSTPFYTNGTNPQLCLNVNETNPCVMSWWVNATGTPGLSYEFYAYATSTTFPDDVDEVNSSFLNITIRSNETTEPLILTTNSTPVIAYLGQNISLSATASDNTQIDECYANITLPDSSIVQVNNTCTAQQTYTTTTLGRHNITFIVNDTSSNIITNTDNYFIVYAVLNFTATFNDSNGSLDTNLQLIDTETQETVRQDDINGTYSQTVPDTIYDLLYQSYGDRLQVRLRQVNLSNQTGNTFGLDRLATPITGYLLTYGVDTNYSFNNATVIVYYDDASFTNEARLRLYKCDNWNFNTQQCDGTWVDVTNDATQNTANDYFEYLTTSFSGFSVGQSSSSSSSGSGGTSTGTWQKIITPAAVEPEEPEECIPDWQCADWQECTNNLQRRYCSDVNNCNSPVATPHMIEECDPTQTITETTTTETQITAETQTTTQSEQEIIVDFKKGEKTDKTKLGYMLLLVLLISYLVFIFYKNKPKFDLNSFNLNKKLKLPVFNLPKLNLEKYKQSLNKKLPKSLKQLKDWFYKF